MSEIQTFLPYADFARSAASLDWQRLGKQRVENLQIFGALTGLRAESGDEPSNFVLGMSKGGWKNHPAVKMWRGYEHALFTYQRNICYEWTKRGHSDTCLEKTSFIRDAWFGGQYASIFDPPWLGDEDFHRAHQSNLIRKNPVHYRPLFGDVPDDLPYVWPV